MICQSWLLHVYERPVNFSACGRTGTLVFGKPLTLRVVCANSWLSIAFD